MHLCFLSVVARPCSTRGGCVEYRAHFQVDGANTPLFHSHQTDRPTSWNFGPASWHRLHDICPQPLILMEKSGPERDDMHERAVASIEGSAQ